MLRAILSSLCAVLLLAACTDIGPRQPGDHVRSLMTGTIAERNAFITHALTDESDRVHQINMQNRSLEIGLQYLANHLNIDAQVDWDALERQGISREHATTTLNLYDATYADGLRAILWQLRPRSGSIGYAVEGGRLVIRPMPAFAFPETAAQRKVNDAVKAKLGEILEAPASLLQARPFDGQFYVLGFAAKMSIIVDWDELTRAGVKRDAPVVANPASAKAGAYVMVLVNQLAMDGPAVRYDIRHGMVRVSTQARLDAEHALEQRLP